MLCDKVTQSSQDQMVTSGSEITLFCTYQTTLLNPDLYWYRRRADQSFQFILYRDNTRSRDAEFVQRRFYVRHSQTHKTFHLVINPVRTEDSATYYCALSFHSGAGAQEVCTQTPGDSSVELPPRDRHQLDLTSFS
jgi:hypothetical protein